MNLLCFFHRASDMAAILLCLLLLATSVFSQSGDSIPPKNQRILEYVIKEGARISPSYEKAVCTEFIIKILEHVTKLSPVEKRGIRIITTKDIQQLRQTAAPETKGVYYALTQSGKGIAIDSLSDVRPGDIVQFWYPHWGHCGIVKSIDTGSMTMELYSSFPSTKGYGIQRFPIPAECYFVRLR